MTPPRQVRIPDEVWARAQDRALAEGRTLSSIMREAVERYADGLEVDDVIELER